MADWSAKLEHWISSACISEVSASKPGNVSPEHGFVDIDLQSFVDSANAIAPVMSLANTRPVGETILQCVKATRAVVDSNTNLGIILLLAPLAAVDPSLSLADGIGKVLQGLTVADADSTFEAIRIASPAGLGEADSQDVTEPPSQDLRTCMVLAADRDTIAAQYQNGFQGVLQYGLKLLADTATWTTNHDKRLGWLSLNLMAQFGDSLVLRKCGHKTNRQVIDGASSVLSADWPFRSTAQPLYSEFDLWLRADGNQRNPGTTADMIAAILFSGLRDGLIVAKQNGQSFEFTA